MTKPRRIDIPGAILRDRAQYQVMEYAPSPEADSEAAKCVGTRDDVEPLSRLPSCQFGVCLEQRVYGLRGDYIAFEEQEVVEKLINVIRHVDIDGRKLSVEAFSDRSEGKKQEHQQV